MSNKGIARNKSEKIIKLLLDKYLIDPAKLKACLPEVMFLLQTAQPSDTEYGHRSKLTQSERDSLLKSIETVLNLQSLTKDDAIKALELSASLVQDGSFPIEIGRKKIFNLVQIVIGQPISKFSKSERFQIGNGESRKEVAITREVHFELSWNDQLVAICVLPDRSKIRSEALKLVGLC